MAYELTTLTGMYFLLDLVSQVLLRKSYTKGPRGLALSQSRSMWRSAAIMPGVQRVRLSKLLNIKAYWIMFHKGENFDSKAI